MTEETPKGNYTGWLDDIIADAQVLQERLRIMKQEYEGDPNYVAHDANQVENRSMVLYLIDKRIHALDVVIDGGIDFNIT